MDEREVRLAMERIRRIEEEARKRLLKEKEKAKESKPKTSKPKSEPAVPKAKESKIPKPPKPKESSIPKKKEPIPAAIKTLVWNKWTGEKEAEAGCYCCRVTTISMRHFHCGHVISEKHGGGVTIDNLRPICANCNLSMGSMNMMDFIERFGLHK